MKHYIERFQQPFFIHHLCDGAGVESLGVFFLKITLAIKSTWCILNA